MVWWPRPPLDEPLSPSSMTARARARAFALWRNLPRCVSWRVLCSCVRTERMTETARKAPENAAPRPKRRSNAVKTRKTVEKAGETDSNEVHSSFTVPKNVTRSRSLPEAGS